MAGLAPAARRGRLPGTEACQAALRVCRRCAPLAHLNERPRRAAFWAALLAVAAAACLGSAGLQLAFAAVAVGLIGMAHGASDLAIVPARDRIRFIVLYLALALACLGWWTIEPSVALPLFLTASAIHFGVEDAPRASTIERAARGLSLVSAPAVIHASALTGLLQLAGGVAGHAEALASGLRILGCLTALPLLVLAIRRSDLRLIAGTLSLLLLPPLVGFAMGFLILHALPQTALRRELLGCRDDAAYLRHTAPVLGLAVLFLAATAAIVLLVEPTGVRSLFAGICALAIPHMLLTPWYEHRAGERPTIPA